MGWAADLQGWLYCQTDPAQGLPGQGLCYVLRWHWLLWLLSRSTQWHPVIHSCMLKLWSLWTSLVCDCPISHASIRATWGCRSSHAPTQLVSSPTKKQTWVRKICVLAKLTCFGCVECYCNWDTFSNVCIWVSLAIYMYISMLLWMVHLFSEYQSNWSWSLVRQP